MKLKHLYLLSGILSLILASCSGFSYKTYDRTLEDTNPDPEPDYSITLDRNFQDYTNFMFLGNRIENFSTYFNTYFNAKENFNDAFEEYTIKTLSNYSDRLDSIYMTTQLSQESIDKFNKAIEKASKVIQYHKSSDFMDESVLLIGKSYYYLGDYLKAERKFSEFISKLSGSEYLDETVLFLSRTQLRLGNYDAIERLNNLIKATPSSVIKAEAYRTLGEYYISKKEYDEAIKNYKESIRLSSDNEFKAQMQFLIASVISRQEPYKSVSEYKKVLDFQTSFDLEYYSKYNYTKNLILSRHFNDVTNQIGQLKIKYKDNPQFVSEIDLLNARYFYEKKEYPKAIRAFKNVISLYPKTAASSDAAFLIAAHYENVNEDYLNAYRFYRFSSEESNLGHYSSPTNRKIKTFKRYYELSSAIRGHQINTEYDTTIINLRKSSGPPPTEGKEKKEGEHKGDGQGMRGFDDSNKTVTDSNLTKKNVTIDSSAIKQEKIINSEFELAELFIYEFNKPDSAEHYLKDAYERSPDYDYKSKVLFALANLYQNQGLPEKSSSVLNDIVQQYPLSAAANESRRMLNLPEIMLLGDDPAESIYNTAETYFLNKEYTRSIEGFNNIINNFPASIYVMRSQYAMGWIYENYLNNPDSAYIYYERVVSADPKSELSHRLADKVSQYKNKDLPDSLRETPEIKEFENKNVPPEEKKDDPSFKNGNDEIKNKIPEEGKPEEKKQDDGVINSDGKK